LEEWREQTAWATYAQTEQDLIIVRALVEMFSDEKIYRRHLQYFEKRRRV
jgi:hypothetical protein